MLVIGDEVAVGPAERIKPEQRAQEEMRALNRFPKGARRFGGNTLKRLGDDGQFAAARIVGGFGFFTRGAGLALGQRLERAQLDKATFIKLVLPNSFHIIAT